MKGTLRKFDPIKNYYIFQPTKNPERPLVVPIETLEPTENYHSFHIQGSVPVKPVKKFIECLGGRRPTQIEQEVRKTVEATIPRMTPNLIFSALACLLGQNEDFLKQFNEFKNKFNEFNVNNKLPQTIIVQPVQLIHLFKLFHYFTWTSFIQLYPILTIFVNRYYLDVI